MKRLLVMKKGLADVLILFVSDRLYFCLRNQWLAIKQTKNQPLMADWF